MVQHFKDRITPTSWQLLLATLYSFRTRGPPLNEEDRRVQIVSPWISDIEHRQYRLSLPIRESVSNELGRELNNLGQVLIALANSGARVELLTHPPDGSWKRDKGQAYKDREARFLRMLAANEVNSCVIKKDGKRWFLTPLQASINNIEKFNRKV